MVPHGYVLRRLAPARLRAAANAPVAFWLHGGTRVPILEQRRDWWRVGWTHGRSGWMPAVELQPHATFVMIDAQTGRVLRRLAAKGEQGPVSDGRSLWSLSDTGITRTSLQAPSAFWSNPVRSDREGSLPEESVWTPDRSAFFLRAGSASVEHLIEVTIATGVVRRANCPSGFSLKGVDTKERLLLLGKGQIWLRSTRGSQKIKRAPGDEVSIVARNGCIYASLRHDRPNREPTGELVRYDPDLNAKTRTDMPHEVLSACLSPDGRTLGVCVGGAAVDLRRADTLGRVLTLHPNPEDTGQFVSAITGGIHDWWTLAGGSEADGTTVIHYTRQGRRIRTWESDGPGIMTPDGRRIYMARESAILSIDTVSGTERQIPFTWRCPLPRRYLPTPSDPDSPTHLEVSALTLTPDGHTLILTEWLNGDPAG